MKTLCVLGSTGSIGTQTLDVAEHLGWRVSVLCACRNIERLEKQIRRFSPAVAVCTDVDAARVLRDRVADTKTRVLGGNDALLAVIREEEFDILVNGIAGMAGTVPTVEAVRAKRAVVTANKEAIVTAWEIIKPLLDVGHTPFLSCDSEHSAVMQCIGQESRHVDSVTLTASGGPFFGKTEDELASVTLADALSHPTWSMGSKITVDSATMMNKGLEIIEAAHLFGLPQKKIHVVIHRESILHSLVTFADGSVMAEMSTPDMRMPIQYALTYPERVPSLGAPLDLSRIGALTFYEPPAWAERAMSLARAAADCGGTAPTVFNTANEIAVGRFLKGELAFCDITPFVENVTERFSVKYFPSLEDILETDEKIRSEV